MKTIFFIFFFQVAFVLNAQSYKTSWTNFKSKSWKVCFNKESYKFLEENVCGRLEFINKKDTSLKIYYTVFDSTKFKKTFPSKLRYWLMLQSCVCIGPKSFSSFELKNNFYLVQYCNRCCFIENSDCDSLRTDLMKYRANFSK